MSARNKFPTVSELQNSTNSWGSWQKQFLNCFWAIKFHQPLRQPECYQSTNDICAFDFHVIYMIKHEDWQVAVLSFDQLN